MNAPEFPLIGLDEAADTLDLVRSDKNPFKTQVSALIAGSAFAGTDFYDAEGYKWTCTVSSDQYKNTFWTRLLAKTMLHDPLLDVSIAWKKGGLYTLDDLKSGIVRCLEKDDDVYTQYVEAEVIVSAVDRTRSFEELVEALDKYIFDVNEDEL